MVPPPGFLVAMDYLYHPRNESLVLLWNIAHSGCFFFGRSAPTCTSINYVSHECHVDDRLSLGCCSDASRELSGRHAPRQEQKTKTTSLDLPKFAFFHVDYCCARCTPYLVYPSSMKNSPSTGSIAYTVVLS